jgi:hypothetical protein
VPTGFQLRPSGLGRRLPEAVQRKMEAFFGAGFDDIRVHVGGQAASIGALAFTIGSDLYFAPGQYNPQTPQGQRLLGHELTHVVQQRAGRVRNPMGTGLVVVQDQALEAEAERMGMRAVSAPEPIRARPAASHPAVAASGLPSRAAAQGAILPSGRPTNPGGPRMPAPIVPPAPAVRGERLIAQAQTRPLAALGRPAASAQPIRPAPSGGRITAGAILPRTATFGRAILRTIDYTKRCKRLGDPSERKALEEAIARLFPLLGKDLIAGEIDKIEASEEDWTPNDVHRHFVALEKEVPIVTSGGHGKSEVPLPTKESWLTDFAFTQHTRLVAVIKTADGREIRTPHFESKGVWHAEQYLIDWLKKNAEEFNPATDTLIITLNNSPCDERCSRLLAELKNAFWAGPMTVYFINPYGEPTNYCDARQRMRARGIIVESRDPMRLLPQEVIEKLTTNQASKFRLAKKRRKQHRKSWNALHASDQSSDSEKDEVGDKGEVEEEKGNGDGKRERSPSPTGTPKKVKGSGLGVRVIGNCLYDAVNDALGNEASNAILLRQLVAAWYANNHMHYQEFAAVENPDAILGLLATQGAWQGNAGDLAPLILALANNIELTIVTVTNTYVYTPPNFDRQVTIYLHNSHYTDRPTEAHLSREIRATKNIKATKK